MVLKASINGPNRRKNRIGNGTILSNDTNDRSDENNIGSTSSNTTSRSCNDEEEIWFKIRSLKRLEEKKDTKQSENVDNHDVNMNALGNACVFTTNGTNGKKLLEKHHQLIISNHIVVANEENQNIHDSNGKKNQIQHSKYTPEDPLLIHFHDFPLFILRALPLALNSSHDYHTKNEKEKEEIEDIIYLSEVHCHNHKICEDTIYKITCCTRSLQQARCRNYDELTAVGVEIFPRFAKQVVQQSSNLSQQYEQCNEIPNTQISSQSDSVEINAKDVQKEIMNHTLYSILTVNEHLVLHIANLDLVCRISKVRVQKFNADPILGGETTDHDVATETSNCMDEPYRGRVTLNTDFYVSSSYSSASSSIHLQNSRQLPDGELPHDVIHITTSDLEWFPVRRVLLAPCIKLTKYTQAGHGKYKHIQSTSSTQNQQRSPDAPINDNRPHCFVPMNCCIFDRVLLFLLSLLHPRTHQFSLELSEVNALSQAADVLGLQPLSDLCMSKTSSFQSRVRQHSYIPMAEVRQRNNDNNELLIILDGMVLDITRWLDEHPGGPSIIPTQALNIDCTCFFEMYHVSRQSFLYLKSFYIGELSPEDYANLERGSGKVSDGFLQSLQSFTSDWRVTINKGADKTIHKSL